MFDKVNFIFNGSETTGYGQHAKYFGEALKKLLIDQKEGNECNIILSTVNSPDFYKPYNGTTIAFCVWESTLFPDDFFKQLLTFDQLWVPSEWQKDCAIKQGFPKDRVKVIPEGVDGDLYKPFKHDYPDRGFEFLHIGKWEDRKSSKEIVETFLKTFPKEEYPEVRLILSIDNPFPVDGMTSTEERFQKYGFNDERLIRIPYIDKKDYVKNLQFANCFVTCARAEGWNLPLIEAMSCGTPSICSGYGAQLDFHDVPELQVKIKEHKKPVNVYNMPDCPGTWAEPDYDNLGLVMQEVYHKHAYYKTLFLKKRDNFVKKWSWENAARTAYHELEILSKNIPKKESHVSFSYNFIKGSFLEIKGNSNSIFYVSFKDIDTGDVLYSSNIKCNNWTKYSGEYFRNVLITVTENNKTVFQHSYNAKDKRVFINFESKSLGDTIAWIPYCEEFRKKHQCKVIVSCWHSYLFEKVYPEIEFVKPGAVVPNIYAQYSIGVYFDGREYKNPRDWRTIPLQRVSSDILGLEFKEIKPEVDVSNAYISTIKRPKKYICISEFSTAECKHWHYPNAWQILSDEFMKMGYNVVSISKESSGLKNIIKCNGNHMDTTMGLIGGCEFFVGVGSGLAWLAWAMGKPTVVISGFSEPFVEFTTNITRITGKGDCTGCDNDIFIPNRSWDEGCFHNKDFSCTRLITPEEVIEQIPYLKKDRTLDFTTAPIMRYSRRQTSFKKYLDLIHNFENPNLIEIGTVRRVPTDPDLPGDGNSTSIFAWYVKNYDGHITAVDISQESINNCITTLNSQGLMNKNIELLCTDGIEFIKNYDKTINGIYIDGFDWSPDDAEKRKASEEFHLEAFKYADMILVSGGVVMFDDCLDSSFTGKGRLAIPYALSTGNYELVYRDYQVILKKIK